MKKIGKYLLPLLRWLGISASLILGTNILGILASKVGFQFTSILSNRWYSFFLMLILVYIVMSFGRSTFMAESRAYKRYRSSIAELIARYAPIILAFILVLGIILAFLNSGVFKWITKNNFVISFLIVLIPLLSVLRPAVLKNLTWKKLSDPWLKWSGVSALTVGGFSLVGGVTDQLKLDLLQKAQNESQIPLDILLKLDLVTILILGLAFLFRLIGFGSSKSEDTYEPKNTRFHTLSRRSAASQWPADGKPSR